MLWLPRLATLATTMLMMVMALYASEVQPTCGAEEGPFNAMRRHGGGPSVAALLGFLAAHLRPFLVPYVGAILA
eukprot:725464-Pyramimonas_sp.AAC.1